MKNFKLNKAKQKDYVDGRGWTGFLVSLVLLSAIAGWIVIEFILLLFSHISITWI